MERNFIDGYTEWQSNPEIVGVNKLPQHATFMPYENFDEAKKADRFASSRSKLFYELPFPGTIAGQNSTGAPRSSGAPVFSIAAMPPDGTTSSRPQFP